MSGAVAAGSAALRAEIELGQSRAIVAFLDGRLPQRATINWALGLKNQDRVKRDAIVYLLSTPDGQSMKEPWQGAWRLIEESWREGNAAGRRLHDEYAIGRRIRGGDRSGVTIREIVDIVRPRLKVSAFSKFELHFRTPPRRPRVVRDLFSVNLSSSMPVKPDVFGLEVVKDGPFLVELGDRLDGEVNAGIDLGARIGWRENGPMQLGRIKRSYFVSGADLQSGEHEPDEFHEGLAASVKLLTAVVLQLSQIDMARARIFAGRWVVNSSPIRLRLWAALARLPNVITAEEVAMLLFQVSDTEFWNQNSYPEIAETRARRFAELSPTFQDKFVARILRGPPRSLWPRDLSQEKVAQAQTFWTVRELRRIEAAGVTLSSVGKSWLEEKIGRFPELAKMSRVDDGFLGTSKATFVAPNPDARYDLLIGEERLRALEGALTAGRIAWDNDPESGARDWIGSASNRNNIIADFETVPDAGAAYPKVWDVFGWGARRPQDASEIDSAPATDGLRVLTLLSRLPEGTIASAIDGLTHWLSSQKKDILESHTAIIVWFKIWPIAVNVTNAAAPNGSEFDLNTVAKASGDSEPMDLDALNSPVGRMIDVFLATSPDLGQIAHAFGPNMASTRMRDAIVATSGRSLVIAQHRLLEHLDYFWLADPNWAHEMLIPPLLRDDTASLALWRAIARKTRFHNVLTQIGEAMAQRALDPRLGRETRQSLAFSLVIECLLSFKEGRTAAIPLEHVQQMIRSLDDEVRAYVAGAIQRFVSDWSSRAADKAVAAGAVFRIAAAPFLERVWPQESSLATPGVAKAFADLPASSGNAFVEAVGSIDRFLVPFACWSLFDYGFPMDQRTEKWQFIDTPMEASALLRLLDKTIGISENAVRPYDLSDALNHIEKIWPEASKLPSFRRLAAAARR